jgi:hypothetical protein
MTEPISGKIIETALEPVFDFAMRGAVTGFRKVSRYFLSPTIMIAGPHNAGKSTLSDYFLTGNFLSNESPMDETQDFEDRLVDIAFRHGPQHKIASFWIRDSRGFFDADPLVKDVEHRRPSFIFFVFDVKKIEGRGAVQTMKYEYVEDWVKKFAMRVKEHIALNSKVKRALCGAAVLINKCDSVDGEIFRRSEAAFEQLIRPQFRDLQYLLDFGEQRFGVFYTTMINGRHLPRQDNPESDFSKAINFMFLMLSRRGVVK